MNNFISDAPLVLFDTQQFSAFEFNEKVKQFKELPLIDIEGQAEKLPKDFKAVYVGGDEQSFLLIGGVEKWTKKISNKVYQYSRGSLQEVLEMFVPRQYFGVTTNNDYSLVYVIGGYNEKMLSLNKVEVFSTESQDWKQLAPMNMSRVNPGVCTLANYVYVFGGRTHVENDDFLCSIERLNIDLNLWNYVKIKLPTPLCNLFAFTVK